MQPPVTKWLPLAFLSRSPIRLALFFLHAYLPHSPLLPTLSPLQKEERRGAGIRRTGNNLHMDTVHRYQSNARAVSVAELKHTHTHAPRGYVPHHGRGTQIVCSWWLCELLQRSPPKPFPSGLPLFCLSLSLASLPFHPSLTSSTPLRGSLLHFPYFLLSLSLSPSRSVLLCRVSRSLCLSRLRLVELPFRSPAVRESGGLRVGGLSGGFLLAHHDRPPSPFYKHTD